MQQKNKIGLSVISAFLLLSFIIFLSSFSLQQNKKWDAPESAKKLKNPVAADDASLAAGKALYMKQCKSCHGNSGRGDGPKAANLDVSCKDFTKEDFKSQTDGEMYWKSTEGRDPMPSFKTKLSDDDRWHIVNYIKTFTKK